MFYTYLWLRYDGTPYYVGKGKGDRAFISDGHGVHRPADRSRIIVQEHLCEANAFAAEIFLVAYYGRQNRNTGCLRNLTDGGEGLSGHSHSEITRRKIGIGNTKTHCIKGHPRPTNWKNRHCKKCKAINQTNYKAKIRSLKGTAEVREEMRRARISATLKGRSKTEDAVRNMTLARRRRETQ